MLLDKFKKAKAVEIERLKQQKQAGHKFCVYDQRRPGFAKALQDKGPGAIIAEYKRASPSKGAINLKFSAEEVAGIYQKGGAAAISVLTEKKYFQGELEYLYQMQAPGLPLLRKDFLYDPLQIEQTGSTPASALLLIVRMFTSNEEKQVLARLVLKTRELGMEPVVEVFQAKELEIARNIGSRIIQVNNRDLDSLQVDTNTARSLSKEKDNREIWICASGIESAEQVSEMAGLGYDACLVGSSLMQAAKPEDLLGELVLGKK